MAAVLNIQITIILERSFNFETQSKQTKAKKL